MITINYAFIIIILNFILLMIILNKLLYKPIKKFLEERQAKIGSDIDSAEPSKQEAENLVSSWQNTNTLSINYNLAAVGTPEGGLNNSGIQGVDLTFWVHFLKPDATSMPLPPTALPMFGDGGNYFYYHEFQRTETSINFDSVFSFDVINNVDSSLFTSAATLAGRSFLFNTSAP